jgi:hypothetical protein
MKHIKIYSWLAIFGLLALAACSSTSTVKQSAAPVEPNSGFDPLKYGESKQPTTFDNDVKTKITNLKTIAVTDINNLEIAIDFSLIDTKTHRVVASFIASGSAADNRIDGETEGYKPNTTKMLKQLSGNLAESVAYHLASQDFVTSEQTQALTSPRVVPGTEKHRYDERNLRIYK